MGARLEMEWKGMDSRLRGNDIEAERNCWLTSGRAKLHAHSPRHPREGGEPCLFIGQETPGRGVNANLVPEKRSPTAIPPRHPREGGEPCLYRDHATPWPGHRRHKTIRS